MKNDVNKNLFTMVKNNFCEYIHKYNIDDSICTLISINTDNLTYNLKLGHNSYVKELLDALTTPSINNQLLKVIIEIK